MNGALTRLFMRVNPTVGAVVIAFVAGWVGHSLVVPRPDVASVTVFDDWRLLCPKRSQAGQPCELSQDVVNAWTHVTLLRFSISANKAEPKINILVPYNVLLPAGIGLKLGDAPTKPYPYRTCNALGCLATISPDAELYDAVLNARQIQVFFSGLDGKSTGHPLSLANYVAAVSAMREAEAKRHSWMRRVLL